MNILHFYGDDCMIVVVSYDVRTSSPEGRTRLRRLAKTCQDYGQRVQLSVFEISLSSTDWVYVKDRILNEMNKNEDSVRFYYLGNNAKGHIEHIGKKPSIDYDGALIV
ncbi:MAG: CRISPR-associated endonuclease Cas2 [Cenarchaeum symbiont of Oopsacas minuta]|nr:CRISPR-associated endonuclease Cas2 [Cenarchaeum symbiont of Oopsacas minuta]